MRRDVQAVVMLLLGTACMRIGLDGSYLYYVKAMLRWPLVAAGAVVAGIGVLGVVAALRKPTQTHEHADEQAYGEGSHHHVPRVAWLLTLPVFAILLVAPGPLGAYAAARDPGTVAKPAGDSDFPALPPGDPVRMQVSEYAVRAVWDQGRSLTGRSVALVGFVSKRPEGGWYLTRIMLACCAADGIATKVEIRDARQTLPASTDAGQTLPASTDAGQTLPASTDAGQTLPEDTWVEVVGTYEPSTATNPDDAVAAMHANSVAVVPAPADPYE